MQFVREELDSQRATRGIATVRNARKPTTAGERFTKPAYSCIVSKACTKPHDEGSANRWERTTWLGCHQIQRSASRRG